MRFGISSINVGPQSAPEVLRSVAQAAEAGGVESLWSYEHVIMPVDFRSRYPYHASGRFPGEADTLFVDPWVALSHAAAVTRRIRLGTGISLLTQANPLYFAKQAASVDYLSGGRLLLGVGVGWLRQEFEALGVPFRRRGARMDDYLRALRALWQEEPVDYRSEFVNWQGFKSRPLPAQRPHPPFIIGGHSPAALRRVARFGDGWFAFIHHREELAERIGALHEALRANGRDPAEVEISALWNRPWDGLAAVADYARLGVARLIVPVHRLHRRDPVAGVQRFAEEVVGREA